MAQSRAAVRVGAVLVLSLAALAGLAYFFFGRAVGGYPVIVTFGDAQGIQEQADVRLAGVKIGAVKRIDLDPSTSRAVVYLRIKPDKNIPLGSTYTITSGGLLGEMYVQVTPPSRVAAGYLPKSESNPPRIEGKDLPTFDQLKEQVAQLGEGSQAVLSNLKVATANMAEITNDPVLRRSLRNTALNAERVSAQGALMTARINQTVDRVNATIEQELPTIQAALADVERTTRQGEPLARNASQTLARAGALVTSLQETNEFIRQTLSDTLQQVDAGPALHTVIQNLAVASEQLKAISENANKISADLAGTSTATSKVGEAVVSVRSTAEKASGLLDRLTGVTSRAGKKRGPLVRGVPQFDLVQRVGSDTHFRADANLALPRADNSAIILGLRDIGEGNKLNLQNSVPTTGRTRLRYGFHASKLSLGADWNLRENPVTPLITSPAGATSFSIDLYDPNDLQLDLYGRQQVNEKLGIVIGVEDILHRSQPTIGLSYRP